SSRSPGSCPTAVSSGCSLKRNRGEPGLPERLRMVTADRAYHLLTMATLRKRRAKGQLKQKETVKTQSSGERAKDERELMELVKDLSEAVVRADVGFLDRALHEDYAHHRPNGIIENRAQYLDNRKNGRVHFESLVADEVKVRVYGDTAVVTGRSTAKGKDQH